MRLPLCVPFAAPLSCCSLGLCQCAGSNVCGHRGRVQAGGGGPGVRLRASFCEVDPLRSGPFLLPLFLERSPLRCQPDKHCSTAMSTTEARLRVSCIEGSPPSVRKGETFMHVNQLQRLAGGLDGRRVACRSSQAGLYLS